jgi:hypothetical protein
MYVRGFFLAFLYISGMIAAYGSTNETHTCAYGKPPLAP